MTPEHTIDRIAQVLASTGAPGTFATRRTHVTRRVGSPYVLVLTKTKALFTREATERKTWTSNSVWLTQAARAFGAAQPTRLAITAPTDGVEARTRRSVRTRR